MHYLLESSQPDRIAFDEMVERNLEMVLSGIEPETVIYYATEDPETFVDIQWDIDSVMYNADSLEFADNMGLIYVEDLAEAKARHRAVCKQVLATYLAERKEAQILLETSANL